MLGLIDMICKNCNNYKDKTFSQKVQLLAMIYHPLFSATKALHQPKWTWLHATA